MLTLTSDELTIWSFSKQMRLIEVETETGTSASGYCRQNIQLVRRRVGQ